MFTQRAALLGFVAFCFYLIAVVNSLPSFYYALTWLSMALLFASLGVALLSLVGLECSLEVTRSRGAAPLGGLESGGALIVLAISNAGTLNKTNVVLELRVGDSQSSVQRLRFLLEALPSGAAIESVLPLSRLPRGKYQLQSARLLGSDVLGLFQMQRLVACDAACARDLVIGPPVLRGEASLEGGCNGFFSGAQRANSSRQGDEMRGTRPYAPGDDLRHVHWKSSARAGELVVKEWEQSGQSSALVIWDGAAGSAWGAGDFESGEWGLILAASLCHAFLAGGTPCDFARLDASPLRIEARSLLAGDLPTPLTEALSGASANRTVAFEKDLRTFARFGGRGRSKATVVSASLSRDLVRGVRALRHQNTQVQVLLIDAASLAERAGDRRFRFKGSKIGALKAPAQPDGEGAVAISSANFELQVTRLREAGAQVVCVAANAQDSAETLLRAAIRLAGQTAG